MRAPNAESVIASLFRLSALWHLARLPRGYIVHFSPLLNHNHLGYKTQQNTSPIDPTDSSAGGSALGRSSKIVNICKSIRTHKSIRFVRTHTTHAQAPNGFSHGVRYCEGCSVSRELLVTALPPVKHTILALMTYRTVHL